MPSPARSTVARAAMSAAEPSSSLLRKLLLAALSVIALVAAPALTAAAPASATATNTPAYRYWGYYELANGQWQFAQTGSDQTNPADGSVEGWRFAISGAEDSRPPRATPTFDEICGSTATKDGSKRVGVVIDYGRAADGDQGAQPPQPRAECAVVPTDASGSDVLAAVAETRVDKGLTCGVDGYPAKGCGEPVNEVSAEAKAADDKVQLAGLAGETTKSGGQAAGGSDSTGAADKQDGDGGGLGTGGWVGVGAVVLVVAIGAAAMLRRRGSAD
ncbi:MAG TPA: SCO2322 family protein [Actinomycetales bacterium]|nr:SCO2322 family protein [Actinomycetales bacterium]